MAKSTTNINLILPEKTDNTIVRDVYNTNWNTIDDEFSGVAEAVTKTHTQNTDQYLDLGGDNQVAVTDVKDAVTKKHANTLDHSQNTDIGLDDTFEATFVKKADTVNVLSDITSAGANIEDAVTKKHEHSNKTELDKLTDGDHDVRTDNPHTVTKTQVALGNVENLQVKLDATSAPGASNDNTQGYAVGSRWVDVTLKKEYVCLDASTGVAVWTETTGAGGGGDTLPIVDTTGIAKGSVDATKIVRFEVDGITTGTTRVLTVPDKDLTLVGTVDKLSVFAATTSLELKEVINDETGSGALVFATSPSLVTPTISCSRARAYRNISAQVIPTAQWTKIQLNAENYDNLGEFDSTTNYRFTAITAGYYLAAAGITISAMAAVKRVLVSIWKNNVPVSQAGVHASYAQDIAAFVCDIIYLAATDYLELFVYQDSGANKNTTYDSPSMFMAIHRIS